MVPLISADTSDQEVLVKFIAFAGDEFYEVEKKIFVTPS